MIQNLTRQEIYEIFNIDKPNCMQDDFIDYVLDMQKKVENNHILGASLMENKFTMYIRKLYDDLSKKYTDLLASVHTEDLEMVIRTSKKERELLAQIRIIKQVLDEIIK
jgi:predicted Zn-dependent protease